jgi:hypothetical protein
MVKQPAYFVRCSWHYQNFGYVLVMLKGNGPVAGKVTDGICPDCAKIETEKFNRKEVK